MGYFEKEIIFRNLVGHKAQKWSRKVNPHTSGITTHKVDEENVEMKILKTDVVC
jgi:hypothetical protein